MRVLRRGTQPGPSSARCTRRPSATRRLRLAVPDNLPHLVYDSLDGERGRSDAEYVREVMLFLIWSGSTATSVRRTAWTRSSRVNDGMTRSGCGSTATSRRPRLPGPARPRFRRMIMVVNDRHHIHHVREKGVRRVADPDQGDRRRVDPRRPGRAGPAATLRRELLITAVHDAAFVDYLRTACADVPDGKSLYPYVFPVRNATRLPEGSERARRVLLHRHVHAD